MINIQHTPPKNVVQLFAELLEVVIVGTALKVTEIKAVALFLTAQGHFCLKMTCTRAVSLLQAAHR